MKILHVVPAYAPEGPGGIENHVAELVADQLRHGHVPVVVTGCGERRPRVEVVSGEVAGCRVHRVHRDDLFFHHHAKAWHPGVEAIFARLLVDEVPDIVHVHHWLRLTCNLVELAAARAVPAIVTLHDTYASCPRCWRIRRDETPCTRPLGVAACRECAPRWGCESEAEIDTGIELYRQAYRHELTRAHAVLTNSASIGDLVANGLDLPPGRIREFPLGYEPRTPRGEPRAVPPPWPEAGARFRFAHWGNLGRHKGVAELLLAMRRLRADQRDALELHLFGPMESPAFAAELQRLADGMPVVFHGRFTFADVARVRPHMGVFPSRCFESLSFVVEECLELGVPCIVSDIGAPPARVGAAALTVPPGDVDALAAALARPLADASLRDRLAAILPPPPPSVRQHAARLLDVYQQVIGRPAPAATPPVSMQQWSQFIACQRDNAQARLCRDGGPQ